MKTLASDDFLGALSLKAAKTRRPEGVTFELTYGCNLRCVHCYNPTHRALPHELTTSEICSLLNQIAVIRQIDRERYIWPHILDAVTKALPQYTWLDELASRAGDGDSTSGNTAVQLTGKSADIQAVTRFVRDLEASPFLGAPALLSLGEPTS